MTTETTKPVRVQRKRTKGYKLPPGTICCTRPNIWGNLFKVGDIDADGNPIDREKAIRLHRFVYRQTAFWSLRKKMREDLGKAQFLACYCPLNVTCHVDNYIEILNDEEMARYDRWREEQSIQRDAISASMSVQDNAKSGGGR